MVIKSIINFRAQRRLRNGVGEETVFGGFGQSRRSGTRTRSRAHSPQNPRRAHPLQKCSLQDQMEGIRTRVSVPIQTKTQVYSHGKLVQSFDIDNHYA